MDEDDNGDIKVVDARNRPNGARKRKCRKNRSRTTLKVSTMTTTKTTATTLIKG